jgi:hypothetical protein
MFRRRSKIKTKVHRAIQAKRTRAIAVTPTSVDVEARTFGFVLSTETPVRTCGELPEAGFTDYDEVLASDGLDESRIAGAPLVDSHDLSTVDNVIGVIESIAKTDATWNGVARLSKSDKGTRILNDIADGIIRQVSVGYVVNDLSVELREGGVPLARATSWTPHEVSVVAVGADPNAVIRSHQPQQRTRTMDPELLAALNAAADAAATAAEAADAAASAAADALAAAPADADTGALETAVNTAEEKAGAALDAADAAAEAVSQADDSEGAAATEEARGKRLKAVRDARDARAAKRAEAAKARDDEKPVDDQAADASAEGARMIRSIAKKSGLEKQAERLIKSGFTVREIRSKLLDLAAARDAAVGEIVSRPATGTGEQPQKRSVAADAYSRMNSVGR